ncbi:MAG: hypothetical protein RBU37_15875, partial [Myxococcota bacterium]|nr:hypothetical protein [Myxococcota bacterium]
MPIPQSRAGVFVQLARSPLSFDKLSASFKPLGLPDLLTASLEGLSASLLERANLSLRVALSPGPMSLPISKGRACTIEIPPSCVLDVEVVVSAAPNEDDGLAVISRLEGQFSRPLLLRNVLTTLSELHAVFDDHKLARLREGLSRSGRWLSDRLSQRPGRLSTHLSTVTAVARRAPSALNVARALLELGREAVEEYTGGVALQSFSAQPVKHNDIWQLQFHFSGEVILNDFVRIPFERVRLASVILPSLHASVQELMSSAPLASGELHGWKIPYAEMGEALSAAFDSVDGAFSFTGRIPDTHVKVPTFDRGMVVARLRSESELQVKGRLVGERRDDLLRLRCDDLELKHGAANLAAVLSIELARADLHSMLFAAQDTPAAERRAMSLLIPRDEGAIPSGALQLRAQIRDGSSLDAFLLDVDIDHPIAAGSTHLRSKLSGNALRGVLEAYLDVGARQLVPSLIDLQMAGAATLDEDSQLSADAHHVELGACDGPFRAQVQWKLGRSLELEFATEMTFDARVTTHIAPFPELSIFRGELLSQTEGELDLVLGLEVKPEPEGFLIDFAGTRASVSVHTLNAHLAERSFELGAARLSVHIDNTYLFSSGIGELSMVLAWDMQSMPFMRWADQSLPLLPAEMLRMVVRAQVSPSGELRLSGDRGRLYDARFLNAILHPMDEQQKWLEIIDAPSAMALLLPLLQTFSERLARWAKEAEIVLRRARRVLKEEKIEKPGDFIPRARMARTLSRILFDDLEHESAIAEVIRGVTEANGLDRRAVQRLLDELIPEHELEFDLDRLLRWLDHILSPLVLAPPTPCKLTPLVEEQGLARSLEDQI